MHIAFIVFPKGSKRQIGYRNSSSQEITTIAFYKAIPQNGKDDIRSDFWQLNFCKADILEQASKDLSVSIEMLKKTVTSMISIHKHGIEMLSSESQIEMPVLSITKIEVNPIMSIEETNKKIDEIYNLPKGP